MNTEIVAISSLIFIALILLIIGGIRKSALWMIFGASLVLAVFLYTLIESPNLSTALSAFSTIALTIFAGVTLFLNFQARKDASDRENRDRKERLLNEIIEWAIKFTLRPKLEIEEFVSTKDTVEYLYRYRSYIQGVINDLVGLCGMSLYINYIALQFGGSLQKSVKAILDNLNTYIKSLESWRESIGADLENTNKRTDIQKKNLERARVVDEYKGQLATSALKTIEEASKLKAKGIS